MATYYVYAMIGRGAIAPTLYVGATKNFFTRMTGHGKRAWIKKVAAVKIIGTFKTAGEANNAEDRAIRKYRPVYNIKLTSFYWDGDPENQIKPLPTKTTYLASELWPIRKLQSEQHPAAHDWWQVAGLLSCLG